jgi:hypothetical protein
MNGKDFFANRSQIETPSGTIGYVEQGSGPVALFVHGVLLQWLSLETPTSAPE